MIHTLSIRNFKSLKHVDLKLKPLNLLMGLNGMGKSSILQSLLLLRQSRDIDRGAISLNDNYIEIGKGKDAMYQYSQNEFISIKLETKDRGLEWNMQYDPDNTVLLCKEEYDLSLLKDISLFNNNFQYLKADRFGPQTDYLMSSPEVIRDKQVGIDGAFVVHYLNVFGNEKIMQKELHHKKAKSDILIHQVEAWLSEIAPGIKLNTTEIPGTNKVLLDFQFETGSLYTSRFRPKNVGFGLTYVLPVIVSLLSFNKDRLILLENPESHIHPRGQAELGKLMALSAQCGTQIIAETHSDHILNGARVAVKEKSLDKDNLGIFYFEKTTNNEEQYSEYTSIKIDANGELSEYPKNFIDEWSNQLFKLM